MFKNPFSSGKGIETLDFDTNVEGPAHYSLKFVKISEADEFDGLRGKLPKYDIILCNISSFRNIEELRKAITRLKLESSKYGGEVLGIDSNWLLLTSRNVKVER